MTNYNTQIRRLRADPNQDNGGRKELLKFKKFTFQIIRNPDYTIVQNILSLILNIITINHIILNYGWYV